LREGTNCWKWEMNKKEKEHVEVSYGGGEATTGIRRVKQSAPTGRPRRKPH